MPIFLGYSALFSYLPNAISLSKVDSVFAVEIRNEDINGKVLFWNENLGRMIEMNAEQPRLAVPEATRIHFEGTKVNMAKE